MANKFMSTIRFQFLTIWFAIAIQCFSATAFGDQRPNIIVILADDMGYSDLGCTGAEIQTPNLDSLAATGLLFTHCYNTSRCCPSRAALLTGQYQWDAGLGHMTSTKSNLPEYQQSLNKHNVTIAEVLRSSGYQTYMSGKWHLGDNREKWPDRRGFEHFYGTPTGGGIYFYPTKFYDRPVFNDGIEVKPDASWYSTDGFTDNAVDYLKNRRAKDRPFFMYIAFIAPHFPLQAKQADIEKYKQTYNVGYDEIRRSRFRKQKELGIVDDKLPASQPIYDDWDKVKDKENEALKMAVYAAQVDCMDQNIGKLMSALRDEDIDKDTVVMFLSDNGGCSNSFNKTPNATIGSRDSNAAYGKWYNVSNTPYRKAKSQVHEGGIMTPLIVHWPNGLKQSGTKTSQPVHIMDIFPTCLNIAEARIPESYEDRTLDPIDGETFIDLLREGNASPQGSRTLCWEHEGNRAIRQGNWKLVSLRKKKWELYDLKSDPYESNDLAARDSNRVISMEQAYRQWAAKHSVQPWPLKNR